MNSFTVGGLFLGGAFILLGVFARSPGQTAISSAIIATGVLIILADIILSLFVFMKNRKQ